MVNRPSPTSPPREKIGALIACCTAVVALAIISCVVFWWPLFGYVWRYWYD
jgi:hypothetical protein